MFHSSLFLYDTIYVCKISMHILHALFGIAIVFLHFLILSTLNVRVYQFPSERAQVDPLPGVSRSHCVISASRGVNGYNHKEPNYGSH